MPLTEWDVQRVAEFLADHALLFLAVGIAMAAVALAVVIAAIHMLRRHRDAVRRAFASAVQYAQGFGPVRHSLARSRSFLPGPYLTVHLLLGLIVTLTVAVFFAIAENVLAKGQMAAFDLAFAEALRKSATPGWRSFFNVVTWLGGGVALAIATAIVAVRLATKGETLMAIGWTAAQAAGWLLNSVLKETFERTRPFFPDPALTARGWSFPSGHAMGTFILVGLGCYVLLRNTASWTTAAVTVTAALAWCLVIAFTRLYLGVHFASDVIAGVVAGAAWVAVSASAFEMIRRRR